MPINPSIALQVQPPRRRRSSISRLAELSQLQNAQQRGKLQGLQIQQFEKATGREDRVRQILQQGGDPEQTYRQLRAEDPVAAEKYRTDYQAQADAQRKKSFEDAKALAGFAIAAKANPEMAGDIWKSAGVWADAAGLQDIAQQLKSDTPDAATMEVMIAFGRDPEKMASELAGQQQPKDLKPLGEINERGKKYRTFLDPNTNKIVKKEVGIPDAPTPSYQAKEIAGPDGPMLANYDPKAGKFIHPDTGQEILNARPYEETIPEGALDPTQLSTALHLSQNLRGHPAYVDMLDIATGKQGLDVGLSQKTGFGDIAAINSFQRMIDPGATVRSEDVVLLQSASSFIQRVFSEYPVERLRTGAKLPESVRDQMRKTAHDLYERRARNYNESVGRQYKTLAAGAGIPFEYIGQDFATTDTADSGIITTSDGKRWRMENDQYVEITP